MALNSVVLIFIPTTSHLSSIDEAKKTPQNPFNPTNTEGDPEAIKLGILYHLSVTRNPVHGSPPRDNNKYG